MAYRNAEKTKTDLIIAAEALVAIHGMAGVSAREIARRSGMKNNVVVQYHFSSIDHLYDEVAKFRMGQLEGIRRSEIIRMDYNDIGNLGVDDLMSLICLPHLKIKDENGHFPYAAFLCHYLPERRPFGFEWVMEAGESATPIMQSIIQSIRAKLPDLPDIIFNRRMTNATLVFLNILRGLPNWKPAAAGQSIHPLIADGIRQSIAVLCAPWVEVSEI